MQKRDSGQGNRGHSFGSWWKVSELQLKGKYTSVPKRELLEYQMKLLYAMCDPMSDPPIRLEVFLEAERLVLNDGMM